jgi:hypothetical protein
MMNIDISNLVEVFVTCPHTLWEHTRWVWLFHGSCRCLQVKAPNPVEMVVTLIRNPAASQLLQQQFMRVAWFRRIMFARVRQVLKCAFPSIFLLPRLPCEHVTCMLSPWPFVRDVPADRHCMRARM